MLRSTEFVANKVLRIISLGMMFALFISILIPVGNVLASPGESLFFQSTGVPIFGVVFSPNTIGPGSVSTLTFTITNADSSPVTDLAFTDNLPAGVMIASPSSASTSCDEATLNAPDDGSTITFSGGQLGANSACSVWVNVTSSTAGDHINVTGDLTSSAGNSGIATGTLTVTTSRPGFSKSFSPSLISFGGRSTLTFTIDNTANASAVTYLAFTDVLPNGMMIADPTNAATDCGSTPMTFATEAGTDTISILFLGSPVQGNEVILAGASCTVTVDVTATASVDNLSGDATVRIGSNSTNYPIGKATATLEVAIDALPMSKTFTDDPVAPGGTAALEFTVYNRNRSDSATNISFSDDLEAMLPGLAPDGALPGSPCGAGSALDFTDGVLSLSGGNLPLEGSCTFSVTLQVPMGAVAGAYPNITGQITGEVSGENVTGTPANDTLFLNPAPVMEKSFIDDPAAAGGSVTLRFMISNTTSYSMTEITFNDDLDLTFVGLAANSLVAAGGLEPEPILDACGMGSMLTIPDPNDTLPSPPFSQYPPDPTQLIFTGGSLAPGASCNFEVVLDIPISIPPGTYTNLISDLTATINGSTYIGNLVSDDLIIIAAPRLSKTFTDDPVLPGDTVILEFSISHHENSPTDATDINFTDDLGATLTGLTAVGLPLNDICGPGSQLSGTSLLSFSGGSLAPGETCTFSVTLQVPAGAAVGSYSNTTSDLIAIVGGEPISSQAASAVLDIAGMHFSKAFIDDPVLPGDLVTLRFTIENLSQLDGATGLFFTDSLSAVISGMTAVGLPATDVCGPGSQISGTTSLTFTGGNLAAGASCTFNITVLIPASTSAGSYHNVTSNLTATLGGTTIVISPAVDELSVQTDWLSLEKLFLNEPARPGGTVTLEFILTNLHGSGIVTGLTFTDDLDAMLSGATAQGLPANDVCGSGSQLTGTSVLTLTGGNLAPGASCTFNVTLQIPTGAALGDYTNTTSQVSGMIGGIPVGGFQANDNLSVSYLEFAKTFADSAVAGGTVILQFDLADPEVGSAAERIAFSDDLGAVLSGLAAVGLPISDVCGSGSQVSGTSFLTFTGGNLNPGETCTFSVTLQIPVSASPGSYLNTTSDLAVDGASMSLPATDQLIIDPFVSIDDVSVDEAAGSADFTVSLNGPAVRDVQVNYATNDGSALAGLDYTTASGIAMIPSGNLTTTVSIAILEDVLDEASETFTVTLTSPVNAALADGEGIGTITDNDEPPTLVINDVSVDEGAVTATFTLTLSTFSGLDVNVDYATSDSSALAGLDYTAAASTALIPAGELSATLDIPILEDTLDENSETFTVTLSSPLNATIADGQGIGTILDNDATPSLSIGDVSVDESAGMAVFTATLSAVSGLDVSVDYATSDGSALAGLDYTGVASTILSMPAGTITNTITVAILEDALDEADETFTVTLSNPVNAVLTNDEGIGTIVDNDATPTISIEDVTVDEANGTAAFTVTLSAMSGREVFVDYASRDGSALSGLDFTGIPTTTLSLPAGTITNTIMVPILDDLLDEDLESFTVVMSNPVNVSIADGTAIGRIIDNDLPPSISIDNVSVDEGVTTATITVTLSSASGKQVAVDYQTSAGTAQSNLDYIPVTGTLTIPAGELIGTFGIPVLEDIEYEPDETVVMTLSNPVNASFGVNAGTLTILDNDYGVFLPLVFNGFIGEMFIYENDFEDGAGLEWSDPSTEITPSGERFLGQFASDAITLTLSNLPTHNQVRITFDLYLIRSWDGNNTDFGPDIWELSLDGNSILLTTFSNFDASRQAYPGSYPGGDFPPRTGAAANNSLGYLWEGEPKDSTYHLTFVIDHTATDLEALFSGTLQVATDESWGLDNIEVVLLP